MSLLPTTSEIADWLPDDGILDTEEKVCAMIEHIAFMATMRALEQAALLMDSLGNELPAACIRAASKRAESEEGKPV